MKILSIGMALLGDNVKNAKFSSQTSLYEYDIVIWDPMGLSQEFGISKSDSGRFYFLDKDYDLLLSTFERRYGELIDFFKKGKSLILLLPVDRVYTGISRDNISVSKFISDLLQIKPITIINGAGKNIELSKDQKLKEIFSDYWNAIGEKHYYDSYLKNPDGTPFLYISGYDLPVATWIHKGTGNLLILPNINIDFRPEENELFIRSIEKLIEKLNKDSLSITPPDWLGDYLIPEENDLIKVLNDKQAELEVLSKVIQDYQKRINDISKFKLLLYGYDTPLENQVCIVLNGIGLKVHKGPKAKHDLEGIYENQTLVIEVKGTNKSAAEKHLRELEEWVDICTNEGKTNIKGILIENAYNIIPLKERNPCVFPKDMIEFAVIKDRCLITTTQLLGIYILIKSKPELKEKVIKDILSTKGVFKGYEDYTKYLLVM